MTLRSFIVYGWTDLRWSSSETVQLNNTKTTFQEKPHWSSLANKQKSVFQISSFQHEWFGVNARLMSGAMNYLDFSSPTRRLHKDCITQLPP